MDGGDENSIDDFALEMLRRAKERSHAISGKFKQPEPENGNRIEKIMEKIDKRSSSTDTSTKSPEKVPACSSPVKHARPILKPITTNDDKVYSDSTEERPIKKSVTTFDADGTIVEAKTFTSDNEDESSDDEEMEMESEAGDRDEDNDVKSSEGEGDVDNFPKDEESDAMDMDISTDEEDRTMKASTTPQLSRTLKKLAEFHSKEEIDSPVHPHTPLEALNSEKDPSKCHISASRTARTTRLSALARTINEWEDDTTHHSIPGSRFSEVPNNNSRASLSGKSKYSSASSPSACSPKSLGGRQGQISGVRLFHNKKDNILTRPLTVGSYSCSSNTDKLDSLYGGGFVENSTPLSTGIGSSGHFSNGIIDSHNGSSNSNRKAVHHKSNKFRETVLTKLQTKIDCGVGKDSPCVERENESSDWDGALIKSLELQGFSRKQVSPLKQIREKSPEKRAGSFEKVDEDTTTHRQNKESPSKVYFGGTPFNGNQSPKKYAAPLPPPLPVQSPVKSPVKSANNFNRSPVKSANNFNKSPVKSTPPREGSPIRSAESRIQSLSPIRSPVKSRFSGSPMKNGGKTSNDESKPVSAIRMQFEGSGQGKVGPVKPERSRLKPYAAPDKTSNSSRASSPVKKFHFGEIEKEKDPSSLSVAERAKLFEKTNFCPMPKRPVVVEVQSKKPAVFTSSPCVDNVKPGDIDISCVTPVSSGSSKNTKRPAPPPPVAAFSGCPPPPPPMPLGASTPTNISSKRRSASPTRGFPGDSHAVKRIKVNAPKPGRIYPSLTDIETETETEAEGQCSEVESMDDSLESQQSLGTEIETIAKACSPIRPAPGGKVPSRYRPSEDFSDTFACATVDALIDEALEGQDMTGTTFNFSTTAIEAEKTATDIASLENTIVQAAAEADLSANSQYSTSSPILFLEGGNVPEEVSFSEADTTASSSFTSSPVALSQLSAPSAVVNVETPQNSHDGVIELKLKNIPEIDQAKIDEEAFVPRPLVHTVSFYRRQQHQQKKADTCSNLNDISEQPESCEESEEEVIVQGPNPGDIIRKLEGEVEGRNLAIAQASKALNWCKALVGFSDSTEYIECERILLIETQRRMALLNSIHRLKTEGALNHQVPEVFSPSKQDVTPSCKGTMKISDISITLRREFFNAHRAECQYHFICLLKNKHHIDHSTLITYESQRQGSTIKFANEFLLQTLDPDFQVNLQIYYLESAKEFLPHEAKYRINAKKDNKQATLMLSPLLTPSKKSGKGDHPKSHIMQSPGGPDVVKSTSFKYCGGLSIDISSLQRTYWELDKASGPLSGGINIKVQCSARGGVEHKGFLTLFEDVSGYGAWVRRWCRLGPAVLEFWKYPEDETEGKKPPLGTLNLHECVTSRVRPAPRDVCARANTLLLVTTRAPHPKDKNTLVISCHNSYTAVRHLISADTREERDSWCQNLNKALANLRAWDPVAKQSVDDTLF